MDNKQLWDSVLAEIEVSVSKANFLTWFKNTKIVKQDNGIIHVGVPNEFVKEWLLSKYDRQILKIFRNISENIRGVEYIIVSLSSTRGIENPQSPTHNTGAFTPELPLNDLYINREDNLNPRYTFDNMVIGAFNELAHSATMAVIKHPGSAYNPLFIHGGTGLGKTHLAQAIGNQIKSMKTGKKVYYTPAEKFAIDYLNSVQNRSMNEFKEKYRRYDVFIMDDVQFMASKERTQEELFHLFNALYENNKQVIFTSDKHPNLLHGFEDRLKSRFGAGMIVDITNPEYEARVSIIQHKLKTSNFSLQPDMIAFIAESIECSVREMEGIVNSIVCQARFKNRELSINEVKMIIKNSIVPKKTASVKDVIRVVSEFYNIEEASLFEKTRKKEIVKPRQIAMYILREDFSISYPTIGEKFGGRDHTTVIHSCDKVKNSIKTNSTLTDELEQIRALL